MASGRFYTSITFEEKNYNKISGLLIGLGTRILRTVFDRLCKIPPNTTAGILGSNKQLLQSLRNSHAQRNRGRKIITDEQWRLMYPTNSAVPVTSEQFDITLLMILLKNIHGLGISNHNVWKQRPTSLGSSIEADLVRMGEFRNKLQHRPGACIEDDEFERLWFDISAVLVRLGGKQSDIDELKHASMDPSETEKYQQILKQWKESDDELLDRLDRIEGKQDYIVNDLRVLRNQLDRIETQQGVLFAELKEETIMKSEGKETPEDNEVQNRPQTPPKEGIDSPMRSPVGAKRQQEPVDTRNGRQSVQTSETASPPPSKKPMTEHVDTEKAFENVPASVSQSPSNKLMIDNRSKPMPKRKMYNPRV